MEKYIPSTAVIILNWNNAALTIECVNSWLKHKDGSFDIYIIDNGSDKEEQSILISYVDSIKGNVVFEDIIGNQDLKIKKNNEVSVTLVLLMQNYGYAKGNNFGLKISIQQEYEYSIICNNDVVLPDDFYLDSLINCFNSDENIVLVGPKIINIDGKIQEPFYAKPNILYPTLYQLFYPIAYPVYKLYKLINYQRFSGLRYVYSVSGCFMVLKNSSLLALELLDENTFLYAEELILGEKIFNKGWKACYYPYTWIIHAHAISTQKYFSKEWNRARMELDSVLYYFKEYRRYNKMQLFLIWLGQAVFSVVYLPFINGLKKLKMKRYKL